VVRRALRLLSANVKQWEAVEPRARGSRAYDDAMLLIARNKATIGHVSECEGAPGAPVSVWAWPADVRGRTAASTRLTWTPAK
jgi:hypothetical protein